MRSNLMSALVHLLPRAECEAVVLAITALIDGLWLRAGLQSEGLTRDIAVNQMREYLRYRIPG
jgi:TetR/AcrR family transcriptional repressor of bet genes